MAKTRKSDRTCSFCGRHIPEDQFLIAGLSGLICGDCVQTIDGIMRDMDARAKRTAVESLKINLLKPHEIKARLDDYVIGQDEAKKVLSIITTSVSCSIKTRIRMKLKLRNPISC